MGKQQQVQQPKGRSRKFKRPPKMRLSIVIFAILCVIIGITIWILDLLGVVNIPLPGIVSIIVATVVIPVLFPLLGLIIALVQWLLPFSPDEPEVSSESHPAPVTSMPQIIINVPSTPSVPVSPPLPPPANTAAYRGIIGLPPPADPKTIQQREKAVREIYAALTQADSTAVVLTGIGGAGKSTLAALVYYYAEQRRRVGNGPFADEPIWLRVDPAVTMADLVGTLIEALGKPLPNMGSLSPQNQALELFRALKTADRPRLVILDQFENLLDWETGHALPDRLGVGEWLDAINSQPCACRVLLTSRPWPQGTRNEPPTCMQEYLVGGLEETEGVELLRKQGVKGSEAELRDAVQRCAGHALSLTLLASLLRTRKLSLTAMFSDPTYEKLWKGNVARNLLDSLYTQQLNQVQRQLLTAFSVYREPVVLTAAQAIREDNPKPTDEQIQQALDGLLAQHLLQAAGEGRYQLHAIVANYAKDHFVEGDEEANQQALREAHARVAQYYQQQAVKNCPPRAKRRQVSDVHDLIEATWQYCQAEQWQDAYELMEEEVIFSGVNRWGGNSILLELYQLLLSDKWSPEPAQTAQIDHYLGWIYDDLGKKEEALRYYEEALRIRREVGDRGGEGTTLSNLGTVYNALGKQEEALRYLEEALCIKREVGDRSGEGYTLNNIGTLFFAQARYDVALACFLLAKAIFGEVLSPKRDQEQEWIDDLHEEVGEARFAALLVKVEPQALRIVEQALGEGL